MTESTATTGWTEDHKADRAAADPLPEGVLRGLDDYEAGRVQPNDEFLNADLDQEDNK